MTRREFASLGLAAAAVVGSGKALAAEPAKTEAAKSNAEHGPHHEGLRKCAQACSDCQRECDACATHCAYQLAKGNEKHLATLMTCQDCADFCAAAAQIVSRGGPFAALVCESCAVACARCAKECARFPDDAHMKRCADKCRECEKACLEMVEHAKHAG